MNKFLTALLIGLAISPSAFAQLEGVIPEDISPVQAQRNTASVINTETAPISIRMDV
jgi:hypothetical protein